MQNEELSFRLECSGAVLIEGPKWCGKTTLAEHQAKSVIKLQDPDKHQGYLQTAATKPSFLLIGENPRLIDEWQEAPVLWDAVRVSVDAKNQTGLYILTGSNSFDKSKTVHSGTGRIARMKLETMTLFETGESNGSVSLSSLFENPTVDIEAKSGGKISYYHDRYNLEADCVLHLRDGKYALIKFKLGSNEIEEASIFWR